MGYEPRRRLDVEAVGVGGASEISGRTLGSSATASPKTTMAVLTDGNPSHAYGVETVRGIGARLLDADRRSRLGRRERSFSP